MDDRDLALHAVRTIRSKGAEEITCIDVSACGTLFDWVVLGNGRSERQVRTLVEEVFHFCKRHGVAHMPVEGAAGWRLIDCHAVIVHAFTPELRAYYALDELYGAGKTVHWEALLPSVPDLDDPT